MPDNREYRALVDVEIRVLEENHCDAEDWARVRVAERFRPDRVKNVSFSGDVRLGVFEAKLTAASGVMSPSGVYYAALHNCTVDDDVRIANVDRYIANYDIGRGALIENVGLLVVDGETTFGNGVGAAVMTESGMRSVPIFDRLSSQLAHLMAARRDRAEVVEGLAAMVARYVDSVRAERGTIGEGARILDSQRLLNMRIGPAAQVTGALSLGNGTLNSSPADPSRVGSGVVARDFIVASGGMIDSGAYVERCFVGQGAHLAQHFVAVDSAFFANCEGERGEAANVLAGPFTTTHHKSTLLLATQYSFFNAGSGTNSSNHMYKLGAVHQGALERGCKTGSGAYLMWPSRVGPFTIVIGRHKRHLDAGAFPFSYLLEENGESVLLPGANLFTTGTLRDGAKWRERDRRRDSDLLDAYRVDPLSPFTVGRMIAARDVLGDLHTHAPADQAAITWNGASIPRSRLRRGWEDYSLGIALYLGEKVALCIETVLQLAGSENLEKKLLATKSWGLGAWCDIGGMLLPRERIERLLETVVDGGVQSIEQFEEHLEDMHEDYAQMEWNWVLTTWLAEMGKEPGEVTRADVLSTLRAWRDAVEQRYDRTFRDAAKEFAPEMHYGFGIDGDDDTVKADFAAVRGTLDDEPVMRAFREQTDAALARADKLLGVLGG